MLLLLVAEFIGGIFFRFISTLLSDAVHNLSDVGAIILSFVAHLISRKSRNQFKTFGYERAETLAAFTNGVILIVISVVLFVEAIQRFWKPEHIARWHYADCLDYWAGCQYYFNASNA